MSDSSRNSHSLCCCFRERQQVAKKQIFFMKILKSLLAVQGALLELMQFMGEGECPESPPSLDPECHLEERGESDEDSTSQDLMFDFRAIPSLCSDSSKGSISEICSPDPNLKPSSDRQRKFREMSPIQIISFSDSSSSSQESECNPNKDQSLPSGSPSVPDTNQPEKKSDRFFQKVTVQTIKINKPERKEESIDEDETSDLDFLIDEELIQWLDEQIQNLKEKGEPNDGDDGLPESK